MRSPTHQRIEDPSGEEPERQGAHAETEEQVRPMDDVQSVLLVEQKGEEHPEDVVRDTQRDVREEEAPDRPDAP